MIGRDKTQGTQIPSPPRLGRRWRSRMRCRIQRKDATKNFNRRLRLMDADNVGQRVPSVSDLGIISARLFDVSRGELQAVRDRAMIYLARVKLPLAALGKLIK